jgi:hypothetical protein
LQDCVNKTIARIKQKLEKEDKRVLNHVVYCLRSNSKAVQQVWRGPRGSCHHHGAAATITVYCIVNSVC